QGSQYRLFVPADSHRPAAQFADPTLGSPPQPPFQCCGILLSDEPEEFDCELAGYRDGRAAALQSLQEGLLALREIRHFTQEPPGHGAWRRWLFRGRVPGCLPTLRPLRLRRQKNSPESQHALHRRQGASEPPLCQLAIEPMAVVT